MDREPLIYDFILDDTVKSLQINTYELVDGKWKSASNGCQEFTDHKGRLALDFKKIAQGQRVAIQSEHNSGSHQHATKVEEDFTGISCATSVLNQQAEIIYVQEVPLAIQILTAQNTVNTYSVDCFFKPEEYEKHGYERVYAITAVFSQKSVGEWDEDITAP